MARGVNVSKRRSRRELRTLPFPRFSARSKLLRLFRLLHQFSCAFRHNAILLLSILACRVDSTVSDAGMDSPPVDPFPQLLQFCRALFKSEDGRRKTRYFCPFGTHETKLNSGFDDLTHLKTHLDNGNVRASLANTGQPSTLMSNSGSTHPSSESGVVDGLPTVRA